MPDLRPVEQFNRAMTSLERRYLKQARQAYQATRQELIDVTLGMGLKEPRLPMTVRRTLEELLAQLTELGREMEVPLQAAAGSLARSQINQVGRVVEVPEFPGLIAATEAQRRQIAALLESPTWVEALQAQLAGELLRLRANGVDEQQAIKLLFAMANTDRASLWRHALNTLDQEAQKQLWSAANSLAAEYYKAAEVQSEKKWAHQAIAGIDERTTDCCLRVHAQVRPLDKPFHLTGTPRFSDYIERPPFHRYCRTAETLYLEEFEAFGVTSAEMRDAARAELTARETTGKRVEIHPASATSRRGQ